MLRSFLASVALGWTLVAFSPAPALAQVKILGKGPGEDCYKAAVERRTHFAAVDLCDSALLVETSTRNRSATFVNRGLLHMFGERWEAARDDFDKALALDKRLAEAYLNRGALALYRKDYAAALTDLDQAILLADDRLPQAYFNRALAREGKGDVAGAYQDLLAAQTLAPAWELPKAELKRYRVLSSGG